jgi:GSH-dependent disulfide-bond oxidoreductase
MRMFPETFLINDKWPAQNPKVLQLYSFPTPNGVKVSIALEELGLEYEAHKVPLGDEFVRSPEFLSLAPNNKIPAIIDPNGPGGEVVQLFESGAILIYLAEKTGKLMPVSGAGKYEVIKWLMWQMGGLGPMLGQLGYFYKFAGKEIEDPRPLEWFVNEGKRLLGVINTQLEGKDWVTGEFSIADIAIAPWLNGLEFYGAKGVLEWESYANLQPYLDRFYARPAVIRGKDIPAR